MVLTGEYDILDFKEYFRLVLELCEKENIFKIIVNNLDMKGTDIPMADRYFLGEEIAKVIGSRIKGAVIWPIKDTDRFTETVARNRGGNMQLFGDFESAEKWILGDE
jgi:hypothetical protein